MQFCATGSIRSEFELRFERAHARKTKCRCRCFRTPDPNLCGAQAASLPCPAACRTQQLPEFPSHDTHLGASRTSNVLGQNTRLRLVQETVAASQSERETL